MSVTVEALHGEKDDELIAFLDELSTDSASVLGYHYPFYRDMLTTLEVGEPIYLGARCEGKLVGYLPALMKKSPAGVVIGSLPYFGPNAGVLCGNERCEQVHSALLEELAQRARTVNAISCAIYTPFQFGDFGLYEKALPRWEVVERFTQYQRLDADVRDPAAKSRVEFRDGGSNGTIVEDEVSAARTVPGKGIRYDLRKAQRLGVTVSSEVTTERMATFFSIYEQNCHEFGIPLKPRTAVEWLGRTELVGKHTRLYFAFHEGEMIGGLMMVWSPKVASYYIPCSLTEARSLQPSTVLIDAAMTEAREQGIEFWNWESSPGRDSGVYQFKKKWGAVESEYRIYIQTFAGQDRLRELGRAGITREFPYYFVWPFDRL
jgi:hypothetical protein